MPHLVTLAVLSALGASAMQVCIDETIPAGSVINCRLRDPVTSSQFAPQEAVLCDQTSEFHVTPNEPIAVPRGAVWTIEALDVRQPGRIVGTAAIELAVTQLYLQRQVFPAGGFVVAVVDAAAAKKIKILPGGVLERKPGFFLWALVLLPLRGAPVRLPSETMLSVKLYQNLHLEIGCEEAVRGGRGPGE